MATLIVGLIALFFYKRHLKRVRQAEIIAAFYRATSPSAPSTPAA